MLGTKCGIIPVLGQAKVATKGLKWNLPVPYAEYTELGGDLISTSNEISLDDGQEQCLEIVTDKRVLFTIELAEHWACVQKPRTTLNLEERLFVASYKTEETAGVTSADADVIATEN
jgi:hypothetical protein